MVVAERLVVSSASKQVDMQPRRPPLTETAIIFRTWLVIGVTLYLARKGKFFDRLTEPLVRAQDKKKETL